MTHGTTRVNLEDVMLSEISQMQNRHCYSASVGPLEESGSLRQRTGSFVGTRAWGQGCEASV